MSHLMNTYARLPVAFVRGEGVFLFDAQGKRYLDAIAGIAVNGLGHAHPRFTAALAAQAARLIHTSNVYQIVEQENLAAELCRLSDMDKVFFCNSGAEANEAAIKLARLYGHQRGIATPTIIVMEKSFHGRTMATLTATGNRKVQAGFEPLLAGFVRVPYDDVASVAQVAAHNKNIVAVLVEPVQGEGGIRLPQPLPDYLAGLRELCYQHNWLLMLDEVQCGIGRTGAWFAYQHTGIKPDVMTLAKGLGSGIPIGACLAAGIAAEVFKPGNHGSTFGGSPFACTAAHTTLKIIADDGLRDRARTTGDMICGGLAARLANVAGVKQVRGLGLMIGVELDRPCGELVRIALERGLLINVTADSVIRLLPPLVLSRDEAHLLIDQLADLIKAFLTQAVAAHA